MPRLNQQALPARHAHGLVRMTQHFVLIALATLAVSAGLAKLLMLVFGRPASGYSPALPLAFLVSTLLLFAGSAALNQALSAVRQERQELFRRHLIRGLMAGGLFMSVQTYGLWTLFPTFRSSSDASLGVTGFAIAVTTLHGLHFLVAVLFVAFVTARAWGDRYDHEYYWGVTVCAWFWHALGVVWLAILVVYAISSLGVGGGPGLA